MTLLGHRFPTFLRALRRGPPPHGSDRAPCLRNVPDRTRRWVRRTRSTPLPVLPPTEATIPYPGTTRPLPSCPNAPMPRPRPRAAHPHEPAPHGRAGAPSPGTPLRSRRGPGSAASMVRMCEVHQAYRPRSRVAAARRRSGGTRQRSLRGLPCLPVLRPCPCAGSRATRGGQPSRRGHIPYLPQRPQVRRSMARFVA